MVVVSVVDRNPAGSVLRRSYSHRIVGTYSSHRNTAGGSSNSVRASPAVFVCKNVRESRQPCIFRMCPDQLPLARRTAVVSDAYAAGGNFTGGGAAGEGECDLQRKTADTEAVYSLYCDNLLGRNFVDALLTGSITHIYA